MVTICEHNDDDNDHGVTNMFVNKHHAIFGTHPIRGVSGVTNDHCAIDNDKCEKKWLQIVIIMMAVVMWSGSWPVR